MAVQACSQPSPSPGSALVFPLPSPALVFLYCLPLLFSHSAFSGFNLFSVPGSYWWHLLDKLDNLKGKLLILVGPCGQRPRHGAEIMLYLLAPGDDIVLRRVNVFLPRFYLKLYRLSL